MRCGAAKPLVDPQSSTRTRQPRAQTRTRNQYLSTYFSPLRLSRRIVQRANCDASHHSSVFLSPRFASQAASLEDPTMRHPTKKYEPLETEDTRTVYGHQCRRKALHERRAARLFALLCFCITLLIISICILIYAWRFQTSELQSAKRVSPFCNFTSQPLLCAMDVSVSDNHDLAPIWDSVDFWEGDLINYFSHQTIYRGPPTLERETAWFNLWHRA